MGTGYKLFDEEAFKNRIEYTQTSDKPTGNKPSGKDPTEAYLQAIDKTTQAILRALSTGSQSNAKNALNNIGPSYGSGYGGGKTPFYDPKSFIDSFEKSLLDGLLGDDFKKEFSDIISNFTGELGLNLEDIPGELGKRLGETVMSKFGDSALGQAVGSQVDQLKEKGLNVLAGGLDKFGDIFSGLGKGNMGAKVANLGKAAAKTSGLASSLGSAGSAAGSLGTALSTTGGAATGLGSTLGATAGTAAVSTASLASLGIAALAVVAAMVVLKAAAWALGPAIEGTKELFEDLKETGNRHENSREKYIEDEKKRLEADMESMIRAPFKILEEAAQQLYDTWDRNVRVINATQGYNKSDLQSLISSYSERLRNEGISSYVSSADITDNLAKVLESGISGRAAEEFAYIATKLNAAIPTQDFFQYGSTYAELAATAIQNGKSEAEAIAYANQQLEQFASNVLYANRQIAGGFSSGLADAQQLFQDSVKIAQMSRTGDPAQLGGVLTAVAAHIGAVAPDLASSLTDAIVQAATGGNSDTLVALRSLAGVNASNTEFLNSVAKDPKKTFSALFSGLANIQKNLGDGAYMERNEALADTFGVSMEALSRVDFNSLANAINGMKVDNSAIVENLELLASGQTTATAEQLKMAQINKYMIEEGLSYVLDNEVARSIQEHMWEEQLAREITEAKYAVDLQGSALDFLGSIQTTLERIQMFLNPAAMFKRVLSVVDTSKEAASQKADIRQLLELGKVGKGNTTSLYQLTTGGVDLNITPSILSHMGGFSAYETAHSLTKFHEKLSNTSTISPMATAVTSKEDNAIRGYLSAGVQKLLTQGVSSLFDSGVNSHYKWGTLGKSSASAVSTLSTPSGVASSLIQTTSATTAMTNSLRNTLEKLLSEDYMYDKFAKEGKSYDEWKASAAKMGIADLDAALEKAGYSVDEVKTRFGDFQNQWGIELKQEREKKEEQFWIDVPTNQTIMIGNQNVMIELITANNKQLEQFYNKHEEFYKAWCEYWVKHTAYNNSYDYSKVAKVINDSKSETGNAIYALAEALNATNVKLEEPAVQTNALLGQILIVVNAIMQQNNKLTIPETLPDTMAGLALNLTGSTPEATST